MTRTKQKAAGKDTATRRGFLATTGKAVVAGIALGSLGAVGQTVQPAIDAATTQKQETGSGAASERPQRAVDLLLCGHACSQSVLATYGPLVGLDKDGARIARGFGSGIGRLSQTCGAVTGAAMVLSLKVPGADLPTKADIPAKEETYTLIQEFAKKFQAANGSIGCTELLGVNLGTPEGRKQFSERGMLKTHCAKFVRSSSLLLEEMLHLA